MPTLAAGLLLLMFFPGIIKQGAPAYHNATGLTQAPFLTRWLLISAAFYLTSALLYVVKAVLRHRRSPDDTAPRLQSTPPRRRHPATPRTVGRSPRSRCRPKEASASGRCGTGSRRQVIQLESV